MAAENFHNRLLADETQEVQDGADALVAEEENNLMIAMRSGRMSADQALNELIGVAGARRAYQSVDGVGYPYDQDDIEAMLASGSSDVKGETPNRPSRNDETSCLWHDLLGDATPQENGEAGAAPGYLTGETPVVQFRN